MNYFYGTIHVQLLVLFYALHFVLDFCARDVMHQYYLMDQQVVQVSNKHLQT